MLTMPTTATRNRKPRRPPVKAISIPVNEACQIAGFGRTFCYELLKTGKLKSIAIGKRRLILVASLEALLQDGSP